MSKSKKIKTVKAIWKHENIKIEFSEPHIQAYNNVLFVNDSADIMYYYYDLSVYGKNKDSNKWNKILSVYAYDAPALFAIPQMVDDLIKNDFDSDDWQKQQFNSKEGKFNIMSKSYDSFSLFNEDDYCLKRIVIFDENNDIENDEYRFFVGKSDDITSYMSSGLLLRQLKKNDVIRLKKTAEEFIEKSIINYNQNTEKYTKKCLKSFKTTKDKTILFKYFTDKDKKQQIETVFVPGDIISELNILIKNNKIKQINFDKDIINCNQLIIKNCTFKGFDDENEKDSKLILSGGSYSYMNEIGNINGDFIIPLKAVYDAYIDMQELHPEYLTYDESMCYIEFSKLIKGDIRKIFHETNISDLEKTWVNPIIDRFWMMREEHGFKNPNRVAKNIIHKIKEDCFKSAKKEKNDKK